MVRIPPLDWSKAAGGDLYGTTSSGGSGGVGTVFTLKTNGSGFAVLKNCGGSDGATPEGSLVRASDGTLYGTTGGESYVGVGTIFRLNPDGSGSRY